MGVCADAISVEVETALSGEPICRIDAARTWSVALLKDAIEATSGIHYLDQCLTVKAKVLEDTDVLKDVAESRRDCEHELGSNVCLPLVVSLVQIPNKGGLRGDIAKSARCALNKLCLGDTDAVIEELAQAHVHTPEDLQQLVHAIFQKALTEPHNSKTHAHIMYSLRSRFPEIPGQVANDKHSMFIRLVLNTCQNEFERLTFSGLFSEDQQRIRQRELSATVLLIGEFFWHGLIAQAVVAQVLRDLVPESRDGADRDEHSLFCACELLQAVAVPLKRLRYGQNLLRMCSDWLCTLRDERNPVSRKPCLSAGARARIAELSSCMGESWPERPASGTGSGGL